MKRNSFVLWIRRIARAVLGLATTLALSALWFCGLPLTWGSLARRKRWRAFVFRAWARSALWSLSIRVQVRGTAPIGPCFLVANHLGYVDIWVIASQTNAMFVSMAELERWPLFGFMARQLGTIFIDRDKKRDIPAVNAQMDAAFEAGYVVVLFPEGRHSRGADVLPFRPSLLAPAAKSDRPIAWATLRYETGPNDPPASQSIPWVGVPLLGQALGLLALERIDAEISFGDEIVRGEDRKQLAEELHARISSAFRPLD